MLSVKLDIDNAGQSENTQNDQRNSKICHSFTSLVSSKQPKTTNKMVTAKPPTNDAKLNVSGFAIGPITVTARIILAVS